MSRPCYVCNQCGLRLYLHRGKLYCAWDLPWDDLQGEEKARAMTYRAMAMREKVRTMREAAEVLGERVRALGGS